MTIAKGFVITFASGLLCAAGGGALGYALAVLSPAYYRGVFQAGRAPGFDPVAVGLGLGISQGLIAGLLKQIGGAQPHDRAAKLHRPTSDARLAANEQHGERPQAPLVCCCVLPENLAPVIGRAVKNGC